MKYIMFALIFSFKVHGTSLDVCLRKSNAVLEKHRLELEQVVRDSIIPKYFQHRWKSAKKMKFPLSYMDLVSKIDVRDFFLLQKISLDNRFLKGHFPVGITMVDDVPVTIEGAILNGAKPHDIIFDIKGRKYWMEISDNKKNIEALLQVQAGAYRSLQGKDVELELRTFSSKEIVSDRIAWLNGKDGIGEVVTTEKSGLFSRIDDKSFSDFGPSWRDEETGLVWSSLATEQMGVERAMEFCAKKGGQLPTKEMLLEFTKKGGWEVFVKNNQHWLWTSSPVHGTPNFFVFYKPSGEALDFKSLQAHYSVCCVANR